MTAADGERKGQGEGHATEHTGEGRGGKILTCLKDFTKVSQCCFCRGVCLTCCVGAREAESWVADTRVAQVATPIPAFQNPGSAMLFHIVFLSLDLLWQQVMSVFPAFPTMIREDRRSLYTLQGFRSPKLNWCFFNWQGFNSDD